MRLSTEQLVSMDSIQNGHNADLKIDDGQVRVWLSRLSKEDGDPFDNTVYIERYSEGKWVLSEYYDGDHPKISV